MIKAKSWKENNLKGTWDITYKIDGVRAFINASEEEVLSRADKPLHGCRELLKALRIQDTKGIFDVELFTGNFDETSSMARTHHGPQFKPEHVYSLKPLDSRLFVKTISNPTKQEILSEFKEAKSLGYEGLVLRQGDTWLKVKDKLTLDLRVLSIEEGKGQFEGDMGALWTSKGKVGTGFTHTQRKELNDPSIIGKIIEVEFMEYTKDGKMRHPRFLRVRWDKEETDENE